MRVPSEGNAASQGGDGGSIDKLLTHWRGAWLAAAEIMLIVGFIYPPPFDVGPPGQLASLGRYVIAVIVGGVFAPWIALGRRQHALRWSATTVVVLVLGLVLFVLNVYEATTYVRQYRDGSTTASFVISDRLTPAGERARNLYMRNNKGREPSDEFLALSAPGRLSDKAYYIWGRKEVVAQELVLAVLYLLLFIALGSTVVLAAQTARCTLTDE